MATPVGHGLAGLAALRLVGPPGEAWPRGPLLLAVFLSLAPDLDFLPGLLAGRPALYHHGISHSLGFALGAGLLASLFLRFPGWSRGRVFLLAFLSYGFHLLLDFVGPDGRPPFGIPLFWPLSPAYLLAPFPLLLGVRHAPSTEDSILVWASGIFSGYNLAALLLELALVGLLVLLAGRLRREDGH